MAELLKTSYMPKTAARSHNIGSRGNKALYVLEVATPTVLGVRARGNNTQPHRKVLAIDGFWGKRYNAESDGAWKSTVPIILTVGSQTKAFSSGSVNGGVRIRNKNQVIKTIPWLSTYLRIYKERVFHIANTYAKYYQCIYMTSDISGDPRFFKIPS